MLSVSLVLIVGWVVSCVCTLMLGVVGKVWGVTQTLMFPTVGDVGGVGVGIRVLVAHILKAHRLISVLF